LFCNFVREHEAEQVGESMEQNFGLGESEGGAGNRAHAIRVVTGRNRVWGV
jgi:hypothetical protein